MCWKDLLFLQLEVTHKSTDTQYANKKTHSLGDTKTQNTKTQKHKTQTHTNTNTHRHKHTLSQTHLDSPTAPSVSRDSSARQTPEHWYCADGPQVLIMDRLLPTDTPIIISSAGASLFLCPQDYFSLWMRNIWRCSKISHPNRFHQNRSLMTMVSMFPLLVGMIPILVV